MVDNAGDTLVDGADGTASGKPKLILVIAVVAVLLIGSGLAALFLLSGNADQGSAVEVAEEPKPQGEPTYHGLDPVFVVNLPPGGKARMLQVGLQVYTRAPEVGEVLERHGPMLRHHLLDVLANQQADVLYTRAGREALQAALQDELRDRLAAVGEDKAQIEALYFTQFVMQ
jgi:flagellar FliL protein